MKDTSNGNILTLGPSEIFNVISNELVINAVVLNGADMTVKIIALTGYNVGVESAAFGVVG